jgi:hypothetical protein
MTPSRFRSPVAATSLALVAVLSGCSNDGNSAGGPTGGSSSTPAVCSDLTALEGSVKQLQNVTIAKGAGDEIQSDLAQIKQDVATLSNDAQTQYRPQVGQLSNSLDALSGELKSLRDDPNLENVSGVQAAVKDVSTNFQDLSSAVSSTC